MTAWTLARAVPGMLLDDDLSVRLLAAFDDAFEPFVSVLDCFYAYLDPRTAPPEHVEALGAWLGADPSEGGSAAWRDEVTRAVSTHAMRGTHVGLAERVERLTGVLPEIEESGGVAWSTVPGSARPPDGAPHVRVRVVADLDAAARDRLAAEVRAAVPAHVPLSLEVENP